MKKLYYITIMACVAIACLQVNYVNSLYNRYITEVKSEVDVRLRIDLDHEQSIRSNSFEKQQIEHTGHWVVKFMSDMTPEEIDSLNRISPPDSAVNVDSRYNVDSIRDSGIGQTMQDLILQVAQDNLLRRGAPLNLHILDSLFAANSKDRFRHQFLLYNKDKVVIDSIGYLTQNNPNYNGALLPIGTEGLMYLQLKMQIPLSQFILLHIWTLGFSVFFMIIALFSLIYQLTVVRKKDCLLKKQEEAINGTIHDLKSPLNSVIALLGMLQKSELDERIKAVVGSSKSGVKHMVSTIEALLIAARGDRRKIVLVKTDIDVPALAALVKNELDVLYKDKVHSIEIIDNLPEDFKVLADNMYIENVITNLIENSLKYSDSGVKVSLTLTTDGDSLSATVKDNGWGIAPRYQKKLFEQFYQVPRSKVPVQKSYGIGLTQVILIIKEHGGKITVDSDEGQGCIFTFTIPLR